MMGKILKKIWHWWMSGWWPVEEWPDHSIEDYLEELERD